MDGDLVIHGVSTIYTKINYTTGACVRYDIAGWKSLIPPALAQEQFFVSLEAASMSKGEREAKKDADGQAGAAAVIAESVRLAPILQVLVTEGVLTAEATKLRSLISSSSTANGVI